MPTYYVADGARIKGDVQAVGEELDRIAGGGLTPARVAELAADSNTYPGLHRQFEWDDAVAAGKYRVEQARYVIRSVLVVYESDPEQQPQRAYHAVVTEDNAREFMPSQSVFEDPDMSAQVVERAYAEFVSFRRKYGFVRELAGVFQAFDELPDPKQLTLAA